MTTETSLRSTEHAHPRIVHQTGSDAVYGIGVIGALVYYLGRATDFQSGVTGVFKALFWPAFLVFKLLEFLKM
jgi:hypothetical protein